MIWMDCSGNGLSNGLLGIEIGEVKKIVVVGGS